MKNFIQDGKTIEYKVAETAIKSGDVRVIGDVAGVAVTDGAVDETVVLNVTGVYELAKGTGAITQGQKVYAAADGSGIVATAEDNKAVGCAWEAADAGDTTVLVKLNVTGVYELAKGTGAITQGQKVYAAADGSGIVATAEDNKAVGCAWEAADAGDTTVLVKLNV